MYDICLTVSAWCIIGLLGVLFIDHWDSESFIKRKLSLGSWGLL